MDTSELDYVLDSRFEISASSLDHALDCDDLEEMYERNDTSYEALAYRHYAWYNTHSITHMHVVWSCVCASYASGYDVPVGGLARIIPLPPL